MQAVSVFSAQQADLFRLDGWQFDFAICSGAGVFTGSDPPHSLACQCCASTWHRRAAPDYRLEGAREVRLAGGRAFQAMRHRIMRQLNERTDMLAGVSHDLRTPLTRIRLQLALMKETADTRAISDDIREMETMIDGYIALAAGGGDEVSEEIAVDKLLQRMVEQARKSHKFDIVPDFIQNYDLKVSSAEKCHSTRLCQYHLQCHSLFDKNRSFHLATQ